MAEKQVINFKMGFRLQVGEDDAPSLVNRLEESATRLAALFGSDVTYDDCHLVELCGIVEELETLIRRARASRIRRKR